MLHLTRVMEQLPDSFADVAKVTRTHVPATNAPSRIDMSTAPASTAAPRKKRGRPLGATDKQPRHRQRAATTRSEIQPATDISPRQAEVTRSEEISINYALTGKIWDRETTLVDPQFIFQISQDIMDQLPDPKTIDAAKKQPDWPKWEEAINSELDSLIARKVFGPITIASATTHLTGYRWTFVRKRNAQGEIVRHKARLVAKGFTQIPGRDYDLTYAPVMDVTTYRYLVAFAQHHHLEMQQLDIVTAYLYGTLDKIIHMEAPPELIKRVDHHSQGEYKHTNSKDGPFGHTNRAVLYKL
jgi:hypothetical protein